MEKQKPYIVIRLKEAPCFEVIHSAGTMKDARYYLQYIALPGDAIFMTPDHPKYAGAGEPSYVAHLISRGKISYEVREWQSQLSYEGSVSLA